MPLFKQFLRSILPTSLIMLLLLPTHYDSHAFVQAAELPSLGDSTSSILSPADEYKIGQVWLRNLRAQADTINDPLMNDYIEHLAYRLAAHSQLEKPQLEIILLNNKEINAFAVPGGILGINGGLFLSAVSEDELSAVLAHELGHLSQRHFVRNLEIAQREQWTGLAALLASIAIAATQGAEPGIAAITSTQAYATQSQLAYSRQFEEEADRIGMQTLAATGMDPYAMPRLFSRLKESNDVPEFLLTHPVTQERIADANNRAAQLPPVKSHNDDLEFQLMRAQAQVMMTDSDQSILQSFKSALDGREKDNTIYRYGLARAYLKTHQLNAATKTIQALRQQDPTRISYNITEAEIDLAAEHYADAIALLKAQLDLNPHNYPLTFYYAQSLMKNKQADQAVPLLEEALADRPHDIVLWKLLADAQGLAGHIVGVHQARAEILFLTGQYDRATEQLRYALALTKDNYQLSAKISLRMEEMKKAKKELSG